MKIHVFFIKHSCFIIRTSVRLGFMNGFDLSMLIFEIKFWQQIDILLPFNFISGRSVKIKLIRLMSFLKFIKLKGVELELIFEL